MIVITAMIFLFGIDYYARMEENVAEQYALDGLLALRGLPADQLHATCSCSSWASRS